MQRQAALQAGRLARATLVAAGNWGPGSTAAAMDIATVGACATSRATAAVAGFQTTAAPAGAAAAILWQRGLQAWAQRQQQQQSGPLSAAGQGPYVQQQQGQRRGVASAQAEPSTSSSNEAAADASNGLGISDAAVQRLKELQAQVSWSLPSGCVYFGAQSQPLQAETVLAVQHGATLC